MSNYANKLMKEGKKYTCVIEGHFGGRRSPVRIGYTTGTKEQCRKYAREQRKAREGYFHDRQGRVLKIKKIVLKFSRA